MPFTRYPAHALSIRHLLITLTGAFLLASTVMAASEADDPAQDRQAQAAEAWNVRRTQHVLDQHFHDRPFHLEVTNHFVILHDTDAQRARVRARLLERTHERFYEAFTSFAPLERASSPLVCVLFADRSDFAHYAERVDWLDMSWSGGYYSSHTNRMALYDAVGAGQSKREQDHRDRATDDGEDVHAQSPQTPGGATASPPLNLASTTHEAAHQLAFNSGLQRRGVMYPFWLSEGLACAFETNRAGQPFGLGELNPTRLSDLRQAMDAGQLIPLHRFVSLVRPPTHDAQHLNAVYAQAWAMFRFLYLHDREKLATYLRRLNQMQQGSRSQAALRNEFAHVFGPIDALEHRWRMHLRTLR